MLETNTSCTDRADPIETVSSPQKATTHQSHHSSSSSSHPTAVMSASPPLTTTSRRRRLLASCLSSAALMTHVESFSLSQNAANAAREDNSPTSSSAESPCGRSTARSRAAVIAAGSSLHSHRHRHGSSTWKKRWTDRDDFALRAVQVQQQQEELADVVDGVVFVGEFSNIIVQISIDATCRARWLSSSGDVVCN
jgi:hypothetical protein